jgi:hypothetical protein
LPLGRYLSLYADALFIGAPKLLAGVLQCPPRLPQFNHVASRKLDRDCELLIGSFPKHLQEQGHFRQSLPGKAELID